MRVAPLPILIAAPILIAIKHLPGAVRYRRSNPLYESDLIHENIQATVAQEFAKRGIVEDKVTPDFIVSYKTHTEEKQETSRNGRPYGFYPFSPFWYYEFGVWGYPFWHQPERTYTYTEGTLILDIHDAATRDLIWRGAVEGNVDNVSNLQKQIQKGIKAIMKKYPITPADAPVLKDENAIS